MVLHGVACVRLVIYCISASSTLVTLAIAHRDATGTAAELELAFRAFGIVDALLLTYRTFCLDVESALGFQVSQNRIQFKMGGWLPMRVGGVSIATSGQVIGGIG